MATATLKFNLPDEQYEYNLAHNGVKYYSSLEDIRQFLRSKVKYGHNYTSIEEALGDCYDQFFKILEDNGTTLDI